MGRTTTGEAGNRTALTRAQMVSALRIAAGEGEAEDCAYGTERLPRASGNAAHGATRAARAGSTVTLAMVLAGTLVTARLSGNGAESGGHRPSAAAPAGSIPRDAAPARGGGGVAQSRQEHPEMLKQVTGVVAATAIGAAAAIGGGASAQAVQWRVQDGGNGHWYDVITHAGPLDWNAASASAQSQGAHLVSVTSASEWQFVKIVADRNSLWNGGHGPWMGAFQNRQSATYSEPSGGWEWVTGEPFVWTSWWIVGPQPSDSCDGWHEDFLHIINRAEMAWNDIGLPGTCSVYPPVSAIIEWSADCNNDGIVDYGQIRDGQFFDVNGNNVPDCCESTTACRTEDCAPGGVVLDDGFDGPNLDPARWSTFLPTSCARVDQSSGHVEFEGRGHLRTIGEFPVIGGGLEIRIRFTYLAGDEFFDTVVLTDAGTSGDAISNGLLATFVGLQGAAPFIIQAVSEFQLGVPTTSGSVSVAPGDTFEAVIRVAPGLASAELRNITHPSGPYTVSRSWSGSPKGHKVVWYNREVCGVRTNLDAVRISRIGAGGQDCNNNGITDACEIANGALDLNHDGIPDNCQCLGDIYVDRRVDGGDLGVLLSHWGPVSAGDAAAVACDLNRDNAVDGFDLGMLLANWGPCGN